MKIIRMILAVSLFVCPLFAQDEECCEEQDSCQIPERKRRVVQQYYPLPKYDVYYEDRGDSKEVNTWPGRHEFFFMDEMTR